MARWPMLATSLLALGLPLRAQGTAAPGDTVLVDRLLVGGDSGVTIHLRKSGVYRATVDPDVTELRLQPLSPHGPATLVSRAEQRPRGIWELYVMGDGDFVLTPAAPVGQSIHVRVIGDPEAAHVLSERAN